MAKLYFRYGSVGSAKTLNLLAVAHAYTQQGKVVLVAKPQIDLRFGTDIIKSRAGLERKADLIFNDDTKLSSAIFANVDCLLIDEAQFLSLTVVEQLRSLTIEANVPVICYGLRTDFRAQLFAGSKRLMELADEVSEVKTTCFYCSRKGVFNLKLVDGKPTREGPTVELGTEEKYVPACPQHYSHSFSCLWNLGE